MVKNLGTCVYKQFIEDLILLFLYRTMNISKYWTMYLGTWLINYYVQAIFPDNTYGVDSGGDPEVIPKLTYDEFKVCFMQVLCSCRQIII